MGDFTLNRAKLESIGTSFEIELANYVRAKLPAAHIIHNAQIFSKQLGKMTQVDLTYISDKAVIVIEAKNWVDYIKGNCDDIEWQGRSRAHINMTVFNPVEQNNIHIRALRNALRLTGMNPPLFYNLVVLPDNTSIKSDCNEVINKSSLVKRIHEIELRSKHELNIGIIEKAIREVCTI